MERLRRIAIDLFLMIAAGVLLGLLSPFNSAAMPFAQRLFFWVGFIVLGYLIFRPVAAVSRWVTEATSIPAWLAAALAALVASLPLAALIAFALGELQVADFWGGSRFASLYAQVAFIGIAIHMLMLIIFRRTPVPADDEAPSEEGISTGSAAAVLDNPFLRRLPPALGSDLLCLQMQDHYVEAHTGAGSTLLLMRLRDAAAELGDAGLQVHRSWWVAHDAVEAIEQEERRTLLRLRGGRRVPVSRASLPQVRAAFGGRPAA